MTRARGLSVRGAPVSDLGREMFAQLGGFKYVVRSMERDPRDAVITAG